MNYEEMSDNEINEQVANLMGGYAGNVQGSETLVKVKDAPTRGLFYREVDYCNNPYDAWPIIVENRISMLAYSNKDEGWFATTDTSFFVDHDNPLRAAMIVFLMMNEKD